MIFKHPLPKLPPLRAAIAECYRADESEVINALLDHIELSAEALDRIADTARRFVVEVRKQRVGKGGLDAFLHEYGLSSEEGVILMCLAEALLRVPDAETADRLIRDKLGSADWEQHLGQSDSLFVNASTWALMLTGKIVNLKEFQGERARSVFSRLVGRAGEPVIRQSVTQAMRILGRQFVMGRSMKEALDRAREDEEQGYLHSFDMLGEAAHTDLDANRYCEAYDDAISAIAKFGAERGPIQGPGISVKLSALHPRYEFAQGARVISELVSRILRLALHAKQEDIGLTIDAEEADRLEPSLDVFEALCADSKLSHWNGLGLAVQAYQKRALPTLEWLTDVARRHQRRLMIRLVKGAYWDTEIKRAQERGLDGYPVFTRKSSTDVSYLACAHHLLQNTDVFYPQFATHNAHTLAAVLEMAGKYTDLEFQRLHGMGEALYEQVVGAGQFDLRCRIYAPVGSHEDLLAYLVRRLLENGANTSFVNRIVDEHSPISEIIADPLVKTRRLHTKPHPRIPLPVLLYEPERQNSYGVDLSDIKQLNPLAEAMRTHSAESWEARPIIGGVIRDGELRAAYNPADTTENIGQISEASLEQVELAMGRASQAAERWDRAEPSLRAECLERVAAAMEADLPALMAIAVREAGKTIPDALSEVREAVDFCRYYAAKTRADFAAPVALPGPTGESNQISLHSRGVFVCISPWNFPLAIFTGQIAAALAAGNAVVAKPAEQTPLMAARAAQLFHAAGIPADVLHLLPGDGATVGAALVNDARTAGVVFTGSTETAKRIQIALAAKSGPIVPLIAETGGQNTMIVDSSALPEQVVVDVLASAFQSAGQRCSALRVLFVQIDIATKVIDMLAGA
ncbi:MAG: bifunctional proline dehydrogenase/L-glutamate gamma-semialdehyde dehydrogenase PutA, partial [Gammaproteobacteria bacterium]|nr:bifunctional proline dehydrogenase/L-glutamate gamma-semialdehyde dehydrogenase PutA [Gammaproteobacteria bacterium]